MSTQTDSSETGKPDTESPEEKRQGRRNNHALFALLCSATFLVLIETIRSWAKLGRMLGWW